MELSLRPADLIELAEAFGISSELVEAIPYGCGHINETVLAKYKSAHSSERFIHQRINQKVFKQPHLVMQNIARVTQHLRQYYRDQGYADFARRSLNLVPTRQGDFFWRSPKGQVWRTYEFVEDTKSYQTVSEPRLAHSVGAAFGEFLRIMAQLQAAPLHATIDRFHDTRNRFENLLAALKSDVLKRSDCARPEIDFALARESIVDRLLDLQRSGQIKGCVTHNDTKLNNVLFDIKTDQALCVVDLDTVMPGQALFDFGDMVRSSTCFAHEDARDLASVRCEPDLFEALAAGFLSQTDTLLAPVEKELLAFSGVLITFEIGMRFLTDYLAGDTYFKIERPQHNLERARAQFALARSIEQQQSALERCVARLS